MKKSLALILALAVIFVALAGCSSTTTTTTAAATTTTAAAVTTTAAAVTEPTNQVFQVAVSLPPANNAWQARLLDDATAEAAKYAGEVEFTIKNAVDDNDQLNQLTAFKDGGYDLIVCLPGNGTLLTPICEEIYDAGIPTVILDRAIESDNYTALVGGDNYGGGVNAARLLGELLGGVGDVAVLRCYTGIPIDLERYNGFAETIAAEFPDIKIIVEGDGEFNRNAGLNAMTNILPAYEKIDAVYAQDDETALGALNAIETAGRTDIKFITGFGGTRDTYAKFEANDPVYKASMSYFPSMGADGIAMAVTILRGESFEKYNIIESVVVDSSNVSQYLDQAY